MKESEGGSSTPLDICRLTEKRGVAYSMSLLALCGFHGRKDMVDLLLKEGAGNTGVIFHQDKRVWPFQAYAEYWDVIKLGNCCGSQKTS